DNIDKVLKNAPQLTEHLTAAADNIGTVAGTLAKNSGKIDAFLSDAAALATGLGETKLKVDGILGDASNVVKGIDPAKVASTVDGLSRVVGSIDQNRDNIDKVLKDAPQLTAHLTAAADNIGTVAGTLARNSGKIDAFLSDAAALAAGLGETKLKVDGLLGDASGVVKGIDPAKVSSTVDGVARIVASVDQNRDKIEQVLSDAPQLTGRLNEAADSLGTVLATLARNSPHIDSFLSDAAALAAGLGETRLRVDGLLGDASNVVKGIDPAKVAAAVDGVARVVASVDQNRDNIDKVLKDAPQLTASLSATADNIRTVSATLARNDPKINSFIVDASALAAGLGDTRLKVDNVLADASGLLRAVDPAKVGATVDDIKRFTGTLDQNRGNLDSIFTDTAQFTGKLGGFAGRVDGVLNGAESVLGSGDTKGALVAVGDAARSIKRLADNLDQRTKEITAGINRVTGSGFRDLEAFASDGRRTLNDLSRTVRGVQRNPQQFIFGSKAPIPEYSGSQ
ncbi:MAG: hypothetical protein JOY94_18070, partial [Methylobacteriaceae bacterium]|nr:hypothetical protein [Methylobacteriaceae bacterium]